MKDSGDRPAREPESATFEAARVGSSRARPPVFILGFLVVIGAMIAISVGSRGLPAATAVPVALAPSLAPTPTLAAAISTVEPAPSQPDGIDVPVATSPPGDIQLLARRVPASIFVHGDVFVPSATWVYVSLRDDAGNVAGLASVSVPGGAGAAQGAGPTLRFDVELAVPASFSGRLWVDATVYDTSGKLAASTRLEVASPLRPRLQFEP